MSQDARQADAVIQELWRVKDAAFEAAGHDPKRFLQQLRERSSELHKTIEKSAISQTIQAHPKPYQR